MATWHQSRNPAGLRSLWTPDPRLWKVIDDKPHQFASGQLFRRKRDAERNARNTGGLIIPPTRYKGAAPNA